MNWNKLRKPPCLRCRFVSFFPLHRVHGQPNSISFLLHLSSRVLSTSCLHLDHRPSRFLFDYPPFPRRLFFLLADEYWEGGSSPPSADGGLARNVCSAIDGGPVDAVALNPASIMDVILSIAVVDRFRSLFRCKHRSCIGCVFHLDDRSEKQGQSAEKSYRA